MADSLPMDTARPDARRLDPVIWAIPLLAVGLVGVMVAEPRSLGILVPLALAAAGIALLAWKRPFLCAGLVPVVFPIPQLGHVFLYEAGAVLVCAAVVLAGIRARRRWLLHLERVEIASLLFVLWGMVTLFWSSSSWWWLFAVRKYGFGTLALWTATRLSRESRNRWDLLAGIALASIALSIATFEKAVSSGLFTAGSAFSHIKGTDLTWGTSNYIGALLVLMLPTCLYLAVHAPRLELRALGWIALPLAGLVMAVAASRGGAMLMVGVMLAYIFRQRPSRRTLLLFAAFTVSIGLLLAGPGSSHFLSRFTSPRELGSGVVRLFLLRAGWRRLLDHFPFGMGFGQGIVEPDHLATGGPHNFLLTAAYEVGVPGVVLWIAVLVLIARRIREWIGVPAESDAARTLLFILVTSVLNSLFEGTFEGLHFHFLFFWIAGLYLGALGSSSPEPNLSVAPAAAPSR